MLASKLNYGDTIGVVGVSNSLKVENETEEESTISDEEPDIKLKVFLRKKDLK